MERREQDPEEKLRREAFNHSDAYGLMVTRRLISEGMRNPSETITREILEQITSRVLNPMLEECASADTLKKFKEDAQKNLDYPLSPPHLSSLIISLIARKLQSEAIEDFKNSEISSISPLSICEYDMGTGIFGVTSTIKDAEDVLRGTYDEESGNIYNEHLTGTASLSDEANYLVKGKTKAIKYADLLKEDTTGKSVVRRAVEEIENPKYEHGPCLREFAVHGARFAEKVYGIVYPLAEKIIKPT